MRISDWSSDVCSSDLGGAGQVARLLLWALCVRLTVSVLWSAAAPVPSRKPDWRAQFLGRRRWIPKISSRRSTAVCTTSDQLSGGTEIRFKFLLTTCKYQRPTFCRGSTMKRLEFEVVTLGLTSGCA